MLRLLLSRGLGPIRCGLVTVGEVCLQAMQATTWYKRSQRQVLRFNEPLL